MFRLRNFAARLAGAEGGVWKSWRPTQDDIQRRSTSVGSCASVGGPVPRELNVLVLIKGTERYVYVYDDASRAELIDALRNQAADPHLSLSWFDAAVLTEKAREQERATAAAPPGPVPRI